MRPSIASELLCHRRRPRLQGSGRRGHYSRTLHTFDFSVSVPSQSTHYNQHKELLHRPQPDRFPSAILSDMQLVGPRLSRNIQLAGQRPRSIQRIPPIEVIVTHAPADRSHIRACVDFCVNGTRVMSRPIVSRLGMSALCRMTPCGKEPTSECLPRTRSTEIQNSVYPHTLYCDDRHRGSRRYLVSPRAVFPNGYQELKASSGQY